MRRVDPYCWNPMAGPPIEALCYRVTLPKGAVPHIEIGSARSTLILDKDGGAVFLMKADQKIPLPMWPRKVDLRGRLSALRFAYSEAHGEGPPVIIMFETKGGRIGLVATCAVRTVPQGERFVGCFPFEAVA